MRVRALCDKYDIPYTTGSLAKQYFLTLRTIHKLALPDRFLWATADDAPETASEKRFAGMPRTGGLRTAIRQARQRRRRRMFRR